MSQVIIEGVIKNIKERTSVYTPIIEAVVNSIQSIEDAKIDDGKITIKILRNNPEKLFDQESLGDITDIEISDNGIGFDKINRDSFDTLYSKLKIKKGSKGFGRFMFLKYFNSVKVKSIFKDDDNYNICTFSFGKNKKIIENQNIVKSDDNSPKTTVYLNGLKKLSLDKKGATLARKLLEKLLVYFVNSGYKCPEISVIEEERSDIILNNYLLDTGSQEIQEIENKNFTLKNDDKSSDFQVKIFKIFYPNGQRSKITLTAHNREVTETPLHEYIPEFDSDFVEKFEGRNKNTTEKDFIIKAYVLSDYLDEHVSLERGEFNFPKKQKDDLYPFSQKDIEKKVSEIVKEIEILKKEIQTKRSKKETRIKSYILNESPWNNEYIKDLNMELIPYKASNEMIETEIQKIKLNQEKINKSQVKKILENDSENNSEILEKLTQSITKSGESELAHYVCNRRYILDLFENLLKRNSDNSAKYEKDIHNIIFPMGENNHSISYEEHNLWLLDERLVFSEYTASDKKISNKNAPTEPDLVVFNKKKAFRNGSNEFSNPLTIFEFKRPKKTNYAQVDDPIFQVGKYVDEIRAGKYETPEGIEKVKVNDSTPVYAYIVCDIVEKIKDFARQHQLTQSADQEGYFGFHSGYKIYIEIISFKKLINDARLRNKIFFHKLGIE